MAAKVKLYGVEAEVRDGAWSSPSGLLLDLLRYAVPVSVVPAQTPNRDLFMAEQAIAEFGGELVSFDQVEPGEPEEGEVY